MALVTPFSLSSVHLTVWILQEHHFLLENGDKKKTVNFLQSTISQQSVFWYSIFQTCCPQETAAFVAQEVTATLSEGHEGAFSVSRFFCWQRMKQPRTHDTPGKRHPFILQKFSAFMTNWKPSVYLKHHFTISAINFAKSEAKRS